MFTKASGGSGSYVWSSLNTDIATVGKKGLVGPAGTVGEAQVKASDGKNPSHSATSTVKVAPPTAMEFIPAQVESLVGESLQLPLSVMTDIADGSKKVFTDCRKMPLTISFSDSTIFKVVELASDVESPVGACTVLGVQALGIGHTTMTASYEYGGVTLKASVVIAGYPPLKVIDPPTLATVALGSSKIVIAEGGPLPWVLDKSGFYETMREEEEDWVVAKGIKPQEGDNLHYFEVTCKQLGEQYLHVDVGNTPTAKNMFPQKSSATTKFSCAHPASLELKPVIVLPTIDGQQMTVEDCKDAKKRVRKRE